MRDPINEVKNSLTFEKISLFETILHARVFGSRTVVKIASAKNLLIIIGVRSVASIISRADFCRKHAMSNVGHPISLAKMFPYNLIN